MRRENGGYSGGVRANLLAALVAIGLALGGGAARAADPVDGADSECEDLKYRIDLLLVNPSVYDASNEGWVWVQNAHPNEPKFVEVSGRVVRSRVATVDYPTTHDTHDQNTIIVVDPGQEHILSNGNEPWPPSNPTTMALEIEWETGIFPSEKSGDGLSPFYPREMWPSPGDRYWAEGHWIFDCGHDRGGKHPSEIHPPRAAAAMRQATYPLYGTGATPVPVTITDLWIHGRGGFVTEVLNCGMQETVLDDVQCPITTTPINDKNFAFDVCLPPRPSDQAILTWLVLPGTRNTLGQQLGVEEIPADGDCANSVDPLDSHTMLRVTAPLAGSSAAPTDVYSRRLIAGWVYPESPPPRHLQVQLKSMNLHDDKEAEGFNGELSFFWLNLDVDPEPWRRLSDYDIPTPDDSSAVCGFDHDNVLEDYDDDQLCGNGELRFNGPRYDFYLRDRAAFDLFTVGYDQDCYDGYFGDHFDFIEAWIICHGGDLTEIEDWGPGEPLGRILSRFGPDDPPDYGIGSVNLEVPAENGDYELRFDISELDLDAEDEADLGVTMPCSFAGEVLLVGNPLTCDVRAANDFGPGLPRGTALDFTANPSSTQIQPATFTLTLPNNVGTNNNTETGACDAPANGALSCKVGTVPAGGTATVPVGVVPTVPGTLTSRVDISTTSTDDTTTNDSAEFTTEAYRAVTLVIRPSEGGVKKLAATGVVPVAVLTVPGFDATQVAVATLCFGDAEAPAERDCTEAHAQAHAVDVDRDRDLDVLLHYEAAQVGIDAADTTACLIGRLQDGSGIYGCAPLPPVR